MSCLPAYLAFRSALHDPRAIQSAIWRRLLKSNAVSAYGLHHKFGRFRTIREFQDATPVVSYDDLIPWIERVKTGEPNVLTSERVLMFERTSGSSAPAKFIPYTVSLRREFQRAIGAWIADLYSRHPALLTGPAYWCITPLAREREITSGGLPVGFDSDIEYFGKLEQLLLRRLMAVPNDAVATADLDTALYITCRFLLQSPELTFISIWNPSFLTILIEYLQHHADELLADLKEGRLRPPRNNNGHLTVGEAALRSDRSRVAYLRDFLSAEGQLSADILWPNLQLISCWTDASAKAALSPMQRLFPQTAIQGKGLLSTEGIVSIPLAEESAPALAITAHFYEFIARENERPLLAHELDVGVEYSVVITTGGGLWRYRTGDRIRVVGFIQNTPLLEFIGREDDVSDLRGEKLNSAFVGEVIAQLALSQECSDGFAMLAPVESEPPFYALFIDRQSRKPDLAESLDRLLRANPHYAYCRRLGQLGPPLIFQILDAGSEAYVRHCNSLGQRVGAVKPTPLQKRFGWERVFRGSFIPPIGNLHDYGQTKIPLSI